MLDAQLKAVIAANIGTCHLPQELADRENAVAKAALAFASEDTPDFYEYLRFASDCLAEQREDMAMPAFPLTRSDIRYLENLDI